MRPRGRHAAEVTSSAMEEQKRPLEQDPGKIGTMFEGRRLE